MRWKHYISGITTAMIATVVFCYTSSSRAYRLVEKINVDVRPFNKNLRIVMMDVNTTLYHNIPYKPHQSRLSLRFIPHHLHRIDNFFMTHQRTSWQQSGHQSVHSFNIHFRILEDPFLSSLEIQTLGCVSCSLLNETMKSEPLFITTPSS
jgi:hypothetical protein